MSEHKHRAVSDTYRSGASEVTVVRCAGCGLRLSPPAPRVVDVRPSQRGEHWVDITIAWDEPESRD